MTMRRKKWRALLALLALVVLTAFFVLGTHTDEKGIASKESEEKAVWMFDQGNYVGRSKEGVEDSSARHAFDIRVSDALPADRSLPDTRHPRCNSEVAKTFQRVSVTVVISFHNEARSALLRTVVSVLNRSPEHLLKEIILVDDYSDDDTDGSDLSVLHKVNVIRNAAREGLVRSRAAGADIAKGSHVVFLDSHCEVNIGWMEPLLHTISQNPKTLASPVIDIIDVETFKYKPSSGELKGVFDWGLNFHWRPLSKVEKLRRRSPTQTFKSPVLPGGLFMVKKSWFQEIGGFDRGLEIWGTENIEVSLKSWLCGGEVRVVPCARVGHVFRTRHPYSFPPNGSAAVFLHNSRRVAEAWLDEYGPHFFDARPAAKKEPTSNIDDTIRLKQRMKCQSFQWFLDNVYAELKPTGKDYLAFGQLRQGNLCLEGHPDLRNNSSLVRLIDCTVLDPTQEWSFSKTGEVRQNKNCLTADHRTNLHQVSFQMCDNKMKQKWSRRRRLLVHRDSDLCLESTMDFRISSSLVLGPCRRATYSQQWDFSVELQAWGDR